VNENFWRGVIAGLLLCGLFYIAMTTLWWLTR
jgi:hypothetical protein